MKMSEKWSTEQVDGSPSMEKLYHLPCTLSRRSASVYLQGRKKILSRQQKKKKNKGARRNISIGFSKIEKMESWKLLENNQILPNLKQVSILIVRAHGISCTENV